MRAFLHCCGGMPMAWLCIVLIISILPLFLYARTLAGHLCGEKKYNVNKNYKFHWFVYGNCTSGYFGNARSRMTVDLPHICFCNTSSRQFEFEFFPLDWQHIRSHGLYSRGRNRVILILSVIMIFLIKFVLRNQLLMPSIFCNSFKIFIFFSSCWNILWDYLFECSFSFRLMTFNKSTQNDNGF